MVELNDLKAWYGRRKEAILQDFCTFLRFKSISTESAYKDEVRLCAEWLCKYLNTIGMKSSLWETSVHPVVFAEYRGGSGPTILLYNHYDVQPVDPLALWNNDPFEPILKAGNIYARGASDNKGQCFYTVQALAALFELAKEKSFNIKYFIEGEEECGGIGSTEILKKRQRELKSDHLIVLDFGLPDSKTPAVSLGMRGLIAMDVQIKGSAIDLHSGLHGGMVLNPNRALAAILTKLWDEKGCVAVPGFYDAVRPITEEERALIDLSFDERTYRKTFGINTAAVESGYSLVESNLLRPSLEINGLSGGYTGEGFKTVIPSVARAKISCRLVPDQDPEAISKAIEAFLLQHLPKGLELTFNVHHGAKAYRTSPHLPSVKVATRVLEEVFDQPCKIILCGATVPIVNALVEASGVDGLLMGMGINSDDIHAPNEHFGLERFEKGFLAVAKILLELR